MFVTVTWQLLTLFFAGAVAEVTLFVKRQVSSRVCDQCVRLACTRSARAGCLRFDEGCGEGYTVCDTKSELKFLCVV